MISSIGSQRGSLCKTRYRLCIALPNVRANRIVIDFDGLNSLWTPFEPRSVES
jgi:hypothetical protein